MAGELKRLGSEARHTDPSKPQHTGDLRTALDLLERAAKLASLAAEGGPSCLSCGGSVSHKEGCEGQQWLAEYNAAKGDA